jgi:alanine racemase
MLETIAERGLGAGIWLLVGNSAAVLDGEPLGMLRELAGRFGMRAMARPGLALYGLAPAFEPSEPAAVGLLRERLRPVMAWKTRVTSVRAIEAGAVVGYNGTFVASEPMRVALLAVGYADGLKRAVAGKGWVLVRGERAPFVGRVSMDQAVVDVTGIDWVTAGDEVVLIGAQGADGISAEDHAGWAGTIVWEVFTSITQRVERVQV